MPESELPESIDWEAVVDIAKKQAVFGIIIESVQFLPPRLRPAGSVAAIMNKFALGQIQANIILDRAAARLSAFLSSRGINGVLLKGQGVARYYRQPQMRQNGDIDFYVGKRAYSRAVDLCLEHLARNPKNCSETAQHFDFFMESIPVELHRLAARIDSPWKKKRFQRWIVEELEQSPRRRSMTVGDTAILLPSYDFDAVYIFYHAWRHFIMGGIGLRQLCDWAMVFHNHSALLDTPRIVDNIHSFGIIKGWKLFACIAVNHLGVAPDKIPLYDPSYSAMSEKILREIMAGGNFGFYSKANLRTPMRGSGLRHGLGKVRNITSYFFALFPLIPVEATFLYFNRLFSGTLSRFKRPGPKN